MKNKKSSKYSLSEVSQAPIETIEVPHADYHNTDILNANDRMPRGIEIDENRIYFYCSVGTSEALELNRLLRKLDIEMKYLAGRLACRTVPIHLHIHSSGGSIFAALSVVDTIKKCDTPVYTYVDGSAASAATLISIVGHKRFISPNSFMLVHQPQLEWSGKLDEFVDEIENQKNIYEKLTKVYLENSKINKEELDELLKHELWLDSDLCLKNGFVDKIH
jgi:ATP-dependent protease ClpP protease subunit